MVVQFVLATFKIAENNFYFFFCGFRQVKQLCRFAIKPQRTKHDITLFSFISIYF